MMKKIICIVLVAICLAGCDFQNKIKDFSQPIFKETPPVTPTINATVEPTESVAQSTDKVEAVPEKMNFGHFTLTFPAFWYGKYQVELVDDTWHISMRTSTREGAHLFSLYVYELNEAEEIISALDFGIEPLGMLESNEGEKFFIGFYPASELPCTAEEEPIYTAMEKYIPEILKSLKPNELCEIYEWDNNFVSDSAPYADVYFNILGRTFTSFKNQSSSVIVEMYNETLLNLHYVKITEDVKYYYTDKNELIGVKDGYIVLFAILTDYMANNGYASLYVRETINAIDAVPFFDVLPKSIPTGKPRTNFFYWKVRNGYAGIVAVGDESPETCYGCVARVLVVSSIRDLINIK